MEEIEKLMRDGGQAGPGYPLAAMLGSAQARLDSLRDEEEHVTTEKKEKEQKDRSAIAAMVERETKLNEEEKKKYAEFLSKDCFSNSDIGDLSTFYQDGGAYDRLSLDGKEQIDSRVEEGIRRGELDRNKLPDHVIDKALRDEKRAVGPAERAIQHRARPGGVEDMRLAPAAQSDEKLDVRSDRKETNESKQSPKPEMPEGLEGLAKLSPVKDTDTVDVPQAGKGNSSLQVGG